MAKLNTSTSKKKRGRREIRSYWNRDILITTRPLRSTEDLDEPPVKIRCDYSFAVARRNFKVFATLCANEHKLGMSLRSRRLLYRSMFGIRCLDFQRKVEIARVILGPIPGDKKKGNRYSTEMSSDSSDSDMEWDVSFGGYVLRSSAPGPEKLAMIPEKLAMVPEPAKVGEEMAEE